MNSYLPSFEEARVSFTEGGIFGSISVRSIIRPSILPEEFAVAYSSIHMNNYFIFGSISVRQIVKPPILPEEFALATSSLHSAAGKPILEPKIRREEK